MSIDEIDGKSHKTELKSSYNYSTNRIKSRLRQLVIYGLGGVHTHTHKHTFVDKRDDKKSGTHWPMADARLV